MSGIIKWIWQLPQHLIALLFILITDAEVVNDSEYVALQLNKRWSGVSLGDYRIYSRRNYLVTTVIDHEKGHTKQSHMLGPLYLLVIGLPSILGNLIHRVIKFDYYKQPWEAWADKLGGVVR